MSKVNGKSLIAVNILSAFLVVGTQVFYNLFISPYVVKTIGVEAQGFIQLAANIITWASIIVSATNSLGGRFILDALTRHDKEKANSYYASIFWGNQIVFLILLVPVIFFIVNIDGILNISPELVGDVRLLFIFVFSAFFISYGFAMWTCAPFVANRIYLFWIGQIISGVINISLTIALFAIFPPRLWYASVVSILATTISIVWFMFIKRSLLPELQLKKAKFSAKRLFELTSAGIWRSLSQLSDLLMTGFDLLICNLLINPVAMGVLGISRAIPSLITSLSNQSSYSFCPALVSAFSRGDTDRMLYEIRRSSKILSVIISIPIVGVMVFGQEFFSLWQPTQDSDLLQTLSILGIFSQGLLIATTPLNNVYVAVNKNKPTAVAGLIAGGANIILEIMLVKFTSLGIFAIAGISSILILLRNICYTTPKAARLLNVKWYSFSYMYLYSIICSAIVGGVGILFKALITPDSWLTFIMAAGLTGLVSIALNALCVFSKSERISLLAALKSKAPKLLRSR